LVVLAERYRIDRVLTLDHRHFRLIRTSAGKTFTVLPRLG
jgi:predicted nucleic acid-binding protein